MLSEKAILQRHLNKVRERAEGRWEGRVILKEEEQEQGKCKRKVGMSLSEEQCIASRLE